MNNFNEFLSIARHKPTTVDRFIDARQSESTESYYFTIKSTDGDIFRLALSDHEADGHYLNAADIEDQMTGDFDELEDEIYSELHLEVEGNCIDYYSVNDVETYDKTTADDIVGQYSIDRAFTKNGYKIVAAELSENDRVLTVKYDDGDTRNYVDYNPVTRFTDASDIARIEYLLDNYDVHEARKYYYNDLVTAQSEADLRDDQDDHETDLLDLLTDQEEIVTIDGVNYVVDYAQLVL